MPLAQLYLAPGRDQAKKKQLIEKVTQAFVESLGVPPESVWVTIEEISRDHWAIGGKTLNER